MRIIVGKKNCFHKNLTMDSDSPYPVSFDQILWRAVSLQEYPFIRLKTQFNILKIQRQIRISHTRLPLLKLYGTSVFHQLVPSLMEKSNSKF